MRKFNCLIESILKGSKRENLSDFIQTRSLGAKKIQKSAEAKGGFSLLTSIHFKAKEIPYNNSAKHANDEDSSYVKQQAEECMKRLQSWSEMSQKEFQTVMGQLEAYGEVYIRSLETKKK